MPYGFSFLGGGGGKPLLLGGRMLCVTEKYILSVLAGGQT